ncbi:hypothetical protein D3Z42_04865 [Lachnospiraceae bacterium]|nr:hypothetical protein [Lachnospiraceae bacterium]NBI74817.1 hypothetical protein [Lachnospiraceae bacterium]
MGDRDSPSSIRCKSDRSEGHVRIISIFKREWNGHEEVDGIKNGKKPTLKQKLFMHSQGLRPNNWLVIKDTASMMEVVSRTSLNKVGGKPVIRKLKK